MKFLLHFTIGCIFNLAAVGQSYTNNWTSLDKRQTPQWFDDAKFGIFIHWGIYSVPAWAETLHDSTRKDWKNTIHYAEWYWRLQKGEPGEATGVYPYPEHHLKTYGSTFQYTDFVAGFNAKLFEPEKWAELFKKSGAKYVILTSKHHDGFCLWPSKKAWNWNSVDLNPHRDLVGDLSSAVKNAGLRMGLYYSLYEWYNPLYLDKTNAYVDDHMLPQLKDIVTRYKPELIYADGEWDHTSKYWKSEDFLAWLYNESPVSKNVVVNDRWGSETRSRHGGYYTSEYGEVNGEKTGSSTIQHKWDEIRGIGRSFGYNKMEGPADYLSSKELINLLIEIVSKGGNLTLNIGPTAEGLIPVVMQQRLIDIGAWLQINGEAIYNTKPFKIHEEGSNIRYTCKGDNTYVICLQWPGSSLTLKNIEVKKNSSIYLLGYDKPLKFKKNKNGFTINLSKVRFENYSNSNAFVFKVSKNKL